MHDLGGLQLTEPVWAKGRLAQSAEMERPLRLAVCGLFAGIGGFEEGFRQQGHHISALCEIDDTARKVLAERFPKTDTINDIHMLSAIPDCDLVTAGFPCQDLSQVGRTKGIGGPNSGLIHRVLKLLDTAPSGVRWLVLENVPFMLHLHKGQAIREITDALSRSGWNWAYRTIDTRAFGLPQRRRRIFLLASRTADPRTALLGQDAGEKSVDAVSETACGFYWTEGHRGLGWAIDAVPPLKGGSGVSIPAPPAIWLPKNRQIVIPAIEDAERLQGFLPGWTKVAGTDLRIERRRWRLIGNAVSVPVAAWLASRLTISGAYDDSNDAVLAEGDRWPDAAWYVNGHSGKARVSAWPVYLPATSLDEFLKYEPQSLSLKASAGFLARLEHSTLRRKDAFINDLRLHVAKQQKGSIRSEQQNDPDLAVSKRMAATKGRDNPAELALRSALYRNGFRYRVHFQLLKGLRRTADIAFPDVKLAIFLDGCFWHGCPIHGTWPKTNAQEWRNKIAENRRRDQDTNDKLKAEGWTVIRIWEHEDVEVVLKRIIHTLRARLKRKPQRSAERPLPRSQRHKKNRAKRED